MILVRWSSACTLFFTQCGANWYSI